MKYIIEFEDEYSMNEGGMKYHQCKQVPYWSVSHGIIKNLTPYTEFDRNDIEDEVWSFAWKIFNMDIGEYAEIFDDKGCSSDYREAKTKYEKWMENKNEIHVGDEVEYGYLKGVVFIVDEVMVEGYFVDDKENAEIHFRWNKRDCKKTGRHFDEVEEMLKKMKGCDSDDSSF